MITSDGDRLIQSSVRRALIGFTFAAGAVFAWLIYVFADVFGGGHRWYWAPVTAFFLGLVAAILQALLTEKEREPLWIVFVIIGAGTYVWTMIPWVLYFFQSLYGIASLIIFFAIEGGSFSLTRRLIARITRKSASSA